MAWKPPIKEWMKLNTDGACIKQIARAGCGGLIRNMYGACISKFVRNLGCVILSLLNYKELWRDLSLLGNWEYVKLFWKLIHC